MSLYEFNDPIIWLKRMSAGLDTGIPGGNGIPEGGIVTLGGRGIPPGDKVTPGGNVTPGGRVSPPGGKFGPEGSVISPGVTAVESTGWGGEDCDWASEANVGSENLCVRAVPCEVSNSPLFTVTSLLSVILSATVLWVSTECTTVPVVSWLEAGVSAIEVVAAASVVAVNVEQGLTFVTSELTKNIVLTLRMAWNCPVLSKFAVGVTTRAPYIFSIHNGQYLITVPGVSSYQ